MHMKCVDFKRMKYSSPLSHTHNTQMKLNIPGIIVCLLYEAQTHTQTRIKKKKMQKLRIRLDGKKWMNST